jgi:hypothetical protein
MSLESIEIQNYRSISQVKLEPCGDFNVLIGRNNSGKSNLLSCIEAFYSSIKPEVINTNARIHILRRREIENYLLSPPANIRHLASRMRSANNKPFVAPTDDVFRSQEEEAAEQLKQLAIWKRIASVTCRPLYPADEDRNIPADKDAAIERATAMLAPVRASTDSAIAEVTRVCEEAINAVEHEWATRKLDIVPGSAILDEVYKRYGFRYDKMRDGIGVASQMDESEIDKELRDFIRVLGNSRL